MLTLPILEEDDVCQVGESWHRVYVLHMLEGSLDGSFARALLLSEQACRSGRSTWVNLTVEPPRFTVNTWVRNRLARLERTAAAERSKLGHLADQGELAAAPALRQVVDAIRGVGNGRWTIYAGVIGPTRQEAIDAGEDFEHRASTMGFTAEVARGEQYKVIEKVWLPGVGPADLGKAGRLAPLPNIAEMVPIVDGGALDAKGIYPGHLTCNGAKLRLDLFKGTSDSSVAVVGRNGSGKSVLLKESYVDLLGDGCRGISMNMDDEDRAQCEYLRGIWMDMTGGAYIDSLRIPPYYTPPKWMNATEAAAVEDYNRRRLHRAMISVKAFIGILAADAWKSGRASGLVHRAILSTFEQAGIDPSIPMQRTWQRDCDMQMLWTTLKSFTVNRKDLSQEQVAVARDMVEELEQHFEGPLSMLQEPVGLADSDNVYLHLASASGEATEERAAAAKMALAVSTLTAALVLERVRGERFTVIKLDEVQRAIRNAAFSAGILDIATKLRKYNGILLTATNMPEIFWTTPGGQALWQQSSYKIIFGLEPDALEMLAQRNQSDSSTAKLPRQILQHIADYGRKGTAKEHFAALYDPARGWFEVEVQLPQSELDRYKTRGLAARGGEGEESA